MAVAFGLFLRSSCSCHRPGAVLAYQPEVENPLEVDGGHAVVEPEPVAFFPDVAELAVGASYEPGDRPLDQCSAKKAGTVPSPTR